MSRRYRPPEDPFFLADDIDTDTVFVTVQFAAEVAEVTCGRIYQLVGDGTFRTRSDAGRRLVAYTDLIRWNEARDTPGRMPGRPIRRRVPRSG